MSEVPRILLQPLALPEVINTHFHNAEPDEATAIEHSSPLDEEPAEELLTASSLLDEENVHIEASSQVLHISPLNVLDEGLVQMLHTTSLTHEENVTGEESPESLHIASSVHNEYTVEGDCTTETPSIPTEVEVPSLASTSDQVENIDQNLLDILECPVCLDYMTPPITMCENGHNICKNCRPHLIKCPSCRQSFLRTRNVALEKIARNLQLPCQNREAGCKECCSTDLLDEHHISCSLQPRYRCPLALFAPCPWEGTHPEIKGHIERSHWDKILLEQDNASIWPLVLATKDTRVIFALGEIFLYRERLDTINKRFYVTVHYIGLKINSARFKYEIELSTGTGNQKVIMCSVTLAVDEDIDEVYRSGNCIRLEYEMVNNFSKEKNLKYALTIARIY